MRNLLPDTNKWSVTGVAGDFSAKCRCRIAAFKPPFFASTGGLFTLLLERSVSLFHLFLRVLSSPSNGALNLTVGYSWVPKQMDTS